MPIPKKPRKKCLVCRKKTQRPNYKYCSNLCQQEYQYQFYIKRWIEGKEQGLSGLGLVSAYIKRYLRRKFGNKCCLCGWSKTNHTSGLVPLVADHIDGNWRNNNENNLRLICPNCDSLSPTYAALNKGKGRKHRAPSKRAEEGRLLIKNRRFSLVAKQRFRKP